LPTAKRSPVYGLVSWAGVALTVAEHGDFLVDVG
jgi:hypothetical protein